MFCSLFGSRTCLLGEGVLLFASSPFKCCRLYPKSDSIISSFNLFMIHNRFQFIQKIKSIVANNREGLSQMRYDGMLFLFPEQYITMNNTSTRNCSIPYIIITFYCITGQTLDDQFASSSAKQCPFGHMMGWWFKCYKKKKKTEEQEQT